MAQSLVVLVVLSMYTVFTHSMYHILCSALCTQQTNRFTLSVPVKLVVVVALRLTVKIQLTNG